MVLQDIPEHTWPAQLMTVLTGKALAEAEPGADYALIKQTIRERFEVTPEASRVKLRDTSNAWKRDPGDVILEMKMLAKRWLIPADSSLGPRPFHKKAGGREGVGEGLGPRLRRQDPTNRGGLEHRYYIQYSIYASRQS